MHAGLVHRIVFVNFSECKQCRLLCWRTYQVFSKMTYIYEVFSFAYYDILYYYFVSFELFQKFHKLERTFAECTFCVSTYISSILFLFCPHTLRFWPNIHKRSVVKAVDLISNPGLAIFFSAKRRKKLMKYIIYIDTQGVHSANVLSRFIRL